MSSFVRGNRDLIKAMNRSLVLNTLRREDVLSRTQLTEKSGLSVGTVSQIITELLNRQWIIEIGEGDYTGGRRQTLIRLNPDAGSAIGLKLMENRVACAVTNIAGKTLYYRDYAYSADANPQAICDKLYEIVQDALNSITAQHGRLLGIGIGVAGVIDAPRGVVHYSPYFGWRDVSLAQMLQDKLAVPVYIENDVNTLTISEQLFGAGRHQQNYIVATIGRGIGMGIVINHQLFRGSKGGGGELGHITVMQDGPQCSCGKRGCLEAVASDPAVVQYVQERLPGNAKALNTLGNILAAAQAGNPVCREALARSGEYFGIALSTMINVLNPSLCILSGEGVTAGEFRLNPMREALKKHTFNDLLDSTEFVVEPADDRMWARGAASLVISKVFESPLAEAQITSL